MDLKKIYVTKNYIYDEILRSCNLVKKFIEEKKLVIYGGESINYALLRYGESIYETYEVPDYDFYSPNNVMDSYELFKIMVKNGFKIVATMSAYHMVTMRVKVYDNFVADITYMPPLMFKFYKKTAIRHNGVLGKHPFLQNSDQNRSMCFPYENEGREVVLHRWIKDFSRINMLYKNYYIMNREVIDPFLKSLKYPDLDKLFTQKIKSGKVTSVDLTNSLVCGRLAFLIYKALYEKKELIFDGFDCIVSDEKSILTGIFEKKFKIEGSPAHMIGKKYLCEDMVYIQLEHKTTYQTLNAKIGGKKYDDLKVVSLNYLIIWAYSNMMRDYKNKIISEIGKDTESIYMYLYLLHIQQEIYKKDFKEEYKIFYPSVLTIGEEEKSEVEHFIEKNPDVDIKPPGVYFRDDDDPDTIFADIPKDFQYHDVLIN